jgi:hypothetical protein
MRYWVYGLDAISHEPREPLFIEADNEEAARQQAAETGMAVEEVEAVQPRAEPSRPPPQQSYPTPGSSQLAAGSDHLIASALVIVFRVLAAICCVLFLILIGVTLASGTVAVLTLILQAVVVVAALLAVAEGLRLGIAIERNTRSRGQAASHDRKRRPGR